jgi:hypothetical protein
MVDNPKYPEDSFEGCVAGVCQAGLSDYRPCRFICYALFKCISYNTNERRSIPLPMIPSHTEVITSHTQSIYSATDVVPSRSLLVRPFVFC